MKYLAGLLGAGLFAILCAFASPAAAQSACPQSLLVKDASAVQQATAALDAAGLVHPCQIAEAIDMVLGTPTEITVDHTDFGLRSHITNWPSFWPYTLNGDGGVPSHFTNFPSVEAVKAQDSGGSDATDTTHHAWNVTCVYGCSSSYAGWLSYTQQANVTIPATTSATSLGFVGVNNSANVVFTGTVISGTGYFAYSAAGDGGANIVSTNARPMTAAAGNAGSTVSISNPAALVAGAAYSVVAPPGSTLYWVSTVAPTAAMTVEITISQGALAPSGDFIANSLTSPANVQSVLAGTAACSLSTASASSTGCVPAVGLIGNQPFTDTTTALTASSAFTGSSRTTPVWATYFNAHFWSDQASAASGAEIDCSLDGGTTWRAEATGTVTASGAAITLSVFADCPAYRVKLTNSTTAETILQLASSFTGG